MTPRYTPLELRMDSLLQRWRHRAKNYAAEAVALPPDIGPERLVRIDELELCAKELHDEIDANALTEDS